VNPLPIPLKCFARLLENIHLNRTAVLNDIYVSRPVECQLKVNVEGDQSPGQEVLKKFENSSTKTVAEETMSSQTPLGLVM
jgi:hypothetical protein